MSSFPPPSTPAQAVIDPDLPSPTADKRFELIAAILLGIAALATAYAAYQSGKLGGDELTAFTESNQALADANFFYAQGQSQLNADNGLFVQYAVAVTEENEVLSDYLRTTLMSANLQEAMDWWEASDEAVTPFDESEDNPYSIEPYVAADELNTTAQEQLVAADGFGTRGDAFDLATVLLAVSLFFAGITITFDRRAVIIGLLGISGLTLVMGLGSMLTA